MKKYIRKYKLFFVLASIILIVCLVDILFGMFIDSYSKKHSLPGDYAKIEYLMNASDEDMIIVGSSNAINAFIPSTIEDRLNITCFNGGCNSQLLPFSQCMIENILKRHKPSQIILTIRADELSLRTMWRINLLNVYYHKGNKSIDYFIDINNGYKTIFLASNLYRYNTIAWRMLLSYVASVSEMGDKGYIPHDVPPIAPVLNDYSSVYENVQLNSFKVNCFLEIIDMCKDAGTNLIVVIPPVYHIFYHDEKPADLKELERICAENGIPLINDSQSSFFLERPELFYDNNHLNHIGTEIYTNIFIDRLKRIIEE